MDISIAGFHQFFLPLGDGLFQKLLASVEFEIVTNGRKADQLVLSGASGIPLVRTTTKYTRPAQRFSSEHLQVAEAITRAASGVPLLKVAGLSFNNAMIEVYGREYYKMGFHSDQCLDLADDSYIALFSCYERPADLTTVEKRKLKVKHKVTGEAFELLLENNSVVLFSVRTNAEYIHKIVLDSIGKHKLPPIDNRWLGITYRLSKTMINFESSKPFLADGQELTLADEAEEKVFYKLRREENRSADFSYPPLGFTLSAGDTMKPDVPSGS